LPQVKPARVGYLYGARDDYLAFCKATVIRRILSENRVWGRSLLGLGKEFVETQNVKSAGGLPAVGGCGIRTHPPPRVGHP
jgi:hypothetical protein